MSRYTVLRASRTVNPAVIEAVTKEAGAVALSEADTPDEWAALMASEILVEDYAPPARVPAAVTPLQARKALRRAGLLVTVTSAVQAAGEEAQEEWDYAVEVRRDNARLVAIAAAAGMTEADIDDLFRLAATL